MDSRDWPGYSEDMFQDTIDAYLEGTKDKNGVNLLYVGVYPYRNVEV